MTWPSRYDPIGVPTDWDEFQSFVLWTSFGTVFWGTKYAVDVWHTIPRMASHKYANPSRNAIVRAAMRETSMLSGTRLGSIALSGGGVTGAVLTAALLVEGAIMFGEFINFVAPTPLDAPIPEATLRMFPEAHR